VLSGSPVVLEPFIVHARFAAEYRNYWWEFVRDSKGASKGVVKPSGPVTPYPYSKTGTNDSAESDQGSNFGRVARIGDLTDTYAQAILAERVAGIEARSWIAFFKSNTEASDPATVWNKLEKRLKKQLAAQNEADADRLHALLDEMSVIMRGPPKAE
jgi:hypothetical protein